jgi:pimeloyl-ACP methyl ester carboxylesterase
MHTWWIPAKRENSHVLLYLHGSALNIGANVTHTRRFHKLGFDVFIISYRGYGLSDGDFPTEEQVYADAEVAWDYLVNTRQIDPGRIFIYGHSIGGAVAIDLAVRHPGAAGLITEATFTSIVDVAREEIKYRFFPLNLLVHQRFDSIAKVAALRIPVLFLHGTRDRYIPFEMSRRLYAHSPEPKYLKLIQGGGHRNSAKVGGIEYLRAVSDFVQSVQNKKPKSTTKLSEP